MSEVCGRDKRISSALALYNHIAAKHLCGDGSIIGPDPGVRFNLRVWRFLKSYLRTFPFGDRYYYLQAQAYWIWDNLALHKMTRESVYKDRALSCADTVLSKQSDAGFWDYPKTEWRGKIPTVEGCFGAFCLLAAFRVTDKREFLDGAIRWYAYMIDHVGFQKYDADSLAVNYFSNTGRGLVPNNSTLAIWFAAELAEAAGDQRYMEYVDPMLHFLERCRLGSGELPYSIQSDLGYGRDHYLCFNYNAYQFLDLYEFYKINGDDRCKRIMDGLARFLSGGLTAAGDARYGCEKDRPVMHYFTSAVAAALLRAHELELGDYKSLADKAFDRLRIVQSRGGGFDYSWGDYGVFSDKRSYPRNQAMILRHLLIAAGDGL